MLRIFCIKLFALLFLLCMACRSGQKKQTIRIIHAGSLSFVMKQVVNDFEKEHPEIRILTEAWGSKDGARQITELGKPCDIFISSDNNIIENFLIPQYAQWSIPFATNEMVIAYTLKSRFAHEINSRNWYGYLMKPEVKTARSSPDADPCGVRTVLLVLLAEKYYQSPGLAETLLAKDLNYIRPKEADLISLLESNAVDYVYIYKSIAVQHNFNFIELPDEINLSNPALSDWYAQAKIKTIGKSPHEQFEETGAPIVYGITIPTNAPNPNGAKDFILFFLNKEKGGAIIERNGQKLLIPQKNKFYHLLPDELKVFASE